MPNKCLDFLFIFKNKLRIGMNMICFIPDSILMCKISFTPIPNLKFTNTWTLCNNNPLIFHFLPFFLSHQGYSVRFYGSHLHVIASWEMCTDISFYFILMRSFPLLWKWKFRPEKTKSNFKKSYFQMRSI